jgi:hypothetical protein
MEVMTGLSGCRVGLRAGKYRNPPDPNPSITGFDRRRAETAQPRCRVDRAKSGIFWTGRSTRSTRKTQFGTVGRVTSIDSNQFRAVSGQSSLRPRVGRSAYVINPDLYRACSRLADHISSVPIQCWMGVRAPTIVSGGSFISRAGECFFVVCVSF